MQHDLARWHRSRGWLVGLAGLVSSSLPGCSLALTGDYTFPDGAPLDVLDAGPAPDALRLDAPSDTSRDASADGGECSVASDCPTPPAGMVASCVMATCELACDDTHDDCDMDLGNGCEIDISADRDHCGSCDRACPVLANTSPSCEMGDCAYVCADGFSNCDTAIADCETPLGDADNCASCGDACVGEERCNTTGATPVCSVDCPSPGTVCGTSCVNVASSEAHCGGCGMPCGGGEAMWSCVSRSCVVAGCNMGFGDCTATAGCETNLNTSLAHCGMCGRPCSPAHASGACGTGVCGIGICDTGFGNCGGGVADGCETPLNTLTDCGDCGIPCAPANATPSCTTMSCTITSCDAGYADCTGGVADGCETSTRSLTDCGGCGVPCALPNATPTCSTGVCSVAACGSGHADCNGMAADGCEISVSDDEFHCGACGNVCAAGTECIAGVCDPVIDVAPGVTHTCALRRSGEALCWGANEAGQLGDGTIVDRSIPLPVAGALRYDRVVAGQNFSCGIARGTGLLFCWGRALNGELGSGSTSSSSTPVAVLARAADAAAFATRRFSDLSAMTSGACALDTTGDVWCWGRNVYGEVGDGTTMQSSSAARVGSVSMARELVTGGNHACVRLDAEVRCWGFNGNGQLGDGTNMNRLTATPVVGLGAVTSLASGFHHTCAIDGASAVSCWGRNDTLDLGISGASRNSPAATGLSADRITCGNGNCIAHGGTGHVAWGSRGNGEHGDGTEGAPRAPTPVPLPGTMEVTLSFGGHACGIDRGRLSCWGSDASTQLGVRDLLLRVPSPVSDGTTTLTGIAALATGGFSTMLIRSGILYAAGWNNTGILGPAQPAASAVPVAVTGLPAPVRAVAAGRNFACAIAGADGARQVWCWGSAAAIAGGGPTLTTVTGGEPITISTGYAHVCALVAEPDGDRVPYCWGNNQFGSLGRGTIGTPADPTPTPVGGGLTDVVEIELGQDHGCARRADGRVFCWGAGVDGRIGDGSTVNRPTPVAVSGISDAVDLGVGCAHSCILRADGSGSCWGANGNGQLGDGTLSTATSPVPIVVTGGLPLAAIVGGGRHTCALSAGRPLCWGNNSEGEHGLGTRAVMSGFTMLGGTTSATSIFAARNTSGGAVHTCALSADGSALCWGTGSFGRLATGEDLTLATPRPVLLDY